jgi:hypothetical protein
VGTDLNHQSLLTQYYVERTIEHWMTEFNIDGFRWDLTKGFTQECTPSDQTCTNAYHADRVAILKQYTDEQWAIDPDFYVIFEHLGTGSGANSSRQEEIEWANYKVDEGKGIMLWGNFNYAFNQNSMGFADSSSFNEIDFENRNFNQPRLVGYAESHDEERLMYKNLLYGAQSGGYNIKNLSTALDRSKAVGAVLLTVPGPKMIWQFGELGYDFGINYCENGTYNNDCRTNPKPIPAENGYAADPERMGVYYAWSTINNIRMNNDVFHTTSFTVASGDLNPRIDIWKESLPDTELKYVIVLANFKTTAQTMNTNFPAGFDTWYNLLTDETIAGTETTVVLQPGQYMLLGNKEAVLGTDTLENTKVLLYPNPASNYFGMNIATTSTEVYAITGQLVKTFGPQQANYNYDVSGLSKGLYLVKVTDTNNRQSTIKLVRE